MSKLVVIPTISKMKDEAKKLKLSLKAHGREVLYSHALEVIAKSYGFRDWNTASAMAPKEVVENV